jgi:hypothetical protein
MSAKIFRNSVWNTALLVKKHVLLLGKIITWKFSTCQLAMVSLRVASLIFLLAAESKYNCIIFICLILTKRLGILIVKLPQPKKLISSTFLSIYGIKCDVMMFRRRNRLSFRITGFLEFVHRPEFKILKKCFGNIQFLKHCILVFRIPDNGQSPETQSF